MTDEHTLEIKKVCPVCRRPMVLLHEIRRAFAENLYVFKCQPCGFSMTEPASWWTRPQHASATPLVKRQLRAKRAPYGRSEWALKRRSHAMRRTDKAAQE